MKNDTHLSIDIETLSTRIDAYVLQIGYSVLIGGDQVISGNMNIMELGQEHRRKDLDTIVWWQQQDEEVRKRVFKQRYAVHFNEARDILGNLCKEYGVEHVWAKPAKFDLGILTSLWLGDLPWHWRGERCLATLIAKLDPNRQLAPEPNTMAHDAEADARWQAEYLWNLLK